MRRKLMLAVMVVVILLVLAMLPSCGKSDSELIKDTIIESYEAWNNDDYSGFVHFYSKVWRAERDDVEVLNAIRSAKRVIGKVEIHEISEPVIADTTAVVEYIISAENMDAQSIKASLVKEDGEWKLSEY